AKITARLVVTFKPSNVLRARVNSDFKVPAPPPKAARKANGAAKLNGAGEAADSHGLPGLAVKSKHNGLGASR
ncbi:MAG: hypothetical protein ACM3NE_07540, partial [Hyphomicrobiales bacterium]